MNKTNLKTKKMNTATLEKMRSMRLIGMHDAFDGMVKSSSIIEYTSEEMMAHLVEAEWNDRHNRRLNRLVKNARFRYQANLSDIDYNHPRNLDKGMLLRLSNCDYVKKGQNVLIIGPTGVGKSFLASALGYQACQQGFKVFYSSTYKFFSNLKMAKADGSYQKTVKKIEKQELLILDDFGLKPMDGNARMALMEVIEDRHQKQSTIITTQLPVKHWHEVIGESTVADAILDRLVHNAHRIDLKGESLRKKMQKD